ncbi:hypothetical protein [Paenibacillus albiflavus]|nr:hypothetical protein [Paenibacillus albiflavus]
MKSAIFAGKVVKIENLNTSTIRNSNDPVEVTFDVSKVWKGPAYKHMVITTAESEISCGYEFRLNTEYLIYASSDGDKFTTGLCAGNNKLLNASSDLALLGVGNEQLQDNPLLDTKLHDDQLNEGVSFDTRYIITAIVVVIAIGLLLILRRKRKG